MHYIYDINLTPSPSCEGLLLPFIDEKAGVQTCDLPLLQIKTVRTGLEFRPSHFDSKSHTVNYKTILVQ